MNHGMDFSYIAKFLKKKIFKIHKRQEFMLFSDDHYYCLTKSYIACIEIYCHPIYILL